MRVTDLDLLFIPERGPTPPDHWIARWSAKLTTARRVPTDDPAATPGHIVAMARSAERPVVLIAHSTGVVASVLAASELAGVLGAFLVAPPDGAALATLDEGVWPDIPLAPLAFRSVLVASRTDPWADFSQSEELARLWGAQFIDAGDAGRIDEASGHGPWPDGLLKLGALLKTLA